MKHRIPSGLAPLACLPFESQECRSLHWMPLAVRYKLDVCQLCLSLGQWQSLSLESRAFLLREPFATGCGSWFERLAVDRGARPLNEDRIAPGSFAEYVWRKLATGNGKFRSASGNGALHAVS
ncbi:nitrate reductase associated protein [Ramlibacter sp. WS9]|uniref:nitrate reductase associated protein n=1 Tax=Ramlibacter sp. WS9 TaxID=1882741 RepID=UPI001144AFDA|nr:nitrate reductase associated protein [Ramlibacter sp. WS9]ROZ78040.1 hypothetical protein EEB15_06195 [Ramlibacter sp. WS9]